jgi:hypothetical protein
MTFIWVEGLIIRKLSVNYEVKLMRNKSYLILFVEMMTVVGT